MSASNPPTESRVKKLEKSLKRDLRKAVRPVLIKNKVPLKYLSSIVELSVDWLIPFLIGDRALITTPYSTMEEVAKRLGTKRWLKSGPGKLTKEQIRKAVEKRG